MSKERESAAAAVESGAKLRMKQAELKGREEQLRNLVASKRSKMLQLLHLPGEGAITELPPVDKLR